jgi:hypothetical protein
LHERLSKATTGDEMCSALSGGSSCSMTGKMATEQADGFLRCAAMRLARGKMRNVCPSEDTPVERRGVVLTAASLVVFGVNSAKAREQIPTKRSNDSDPTCTVDLATSKAHFRCFAPDELLDTCECKTKPTCLSSASSANRMAQLKLLNSDRSFRSTLIWSVIQLLHEFRLPTLSVSKVHNNAHESRVSRLVLIS